MTILEFQPVKNATPIPATEENGGKQLAALLSWWRYRVRPPIAPAHLRGDLGLPPDGDAGQYEGVPTIKPMLLVLWRA
ncbi:hypothetical protein [Devosia sp. DBB001]|nr:hypothetical protein [Devosia sp. DBB001]